LARSGYILCVYRLVHGLDRSAGILPRPPRPGAFPAVPRPVRALALHPAVVRRAGAAGRAAGAPLQVLLPPAHHRVVERVEKCTKFRNRFVTSQFQEHSSRRLKNRTSSVQNAPPYRHRGQPGGRHAARAAAPLAHHRQYLRAVRTVRGFCGEGVRQFERGGPRIDPDKDYDESTLSYDLLGEYVGGTLGVAAHVEIEIRL